MDQQTTNGKNVLIEAFDLTRKMEGLLFCYLRFVFLFLESAWLYRSTAINRQPGIVNTYLFDFRP